MIGWLRSRSRRRRTGQQLYERIVAQSRDPALYETCSVPDTMDGRLEMVLLHTVLVLDRLQSEGVPGQRLGQHLMEQLVAGVDDALRRIGLGDDSVAPRIKRLAGALGERARDYRAALQAEAAAAPGTPSAPSLSAATLEDAILGHALGTEPGAATPGQRTAANRLADYVRRTRAALAAMPSADLFSGDLSFPAVFVTDAGLLETRA